MYGTREAGAILGGSLPRSAGKEFFNEMDDFFENSVRLSGDGGRKGGSKYDDRARHDEHEAITSQPVRVTGGTAEEEGGIHPIEFDKILISFIVFCVLF